MGHPRVKEASVVGVPDERWGVRPLATIVLIEGESLTAEVRTTSVGKFDRKVIRRSYADGAPEVTTL